MNNDRYLCKGHGADFIIKLTKPFYSDGAVIVAQLVERLLPTPEISSLIPVNSKFYLLSIVIKDEKK